MKFIAICLHCLDMRDFHSHLRDTPFLDGLRKRSTFIPMGRGQGHNQTDSLNAELTGIWTARYCDSRLTDSGFQSATCCRLPKTVLEIMEENDYRLFTYIGRGNYHPDVGSHAVEGGMTSFWLKDEPERLQQFNAPSQMTLEELLNHVRGCKDKFYAHIFLRSTHRPWGQKEGLCALMGLPPSDYPDDAYCARKAALEQPDAFAALRRRGLARADRQLAGIFDATQDIEDVTYLVYSNHGEVYDHFRYHLTHQATSSGMIIGTSHGKYPYEVLYANMQMWLIPDRPAKVMAGIGRSIDVTPTLLDLAGIDTGPMDGESMLPAFAEGRFPERERFAETEMGHGCLSMVRRDGYKLASTGPLPKKDDETAKYGPDHHRLAIFDLKSDPYEYVNLIDSDPGRDVLQWAIETHASLKRPVVAKI